MTYNSVQEIFASVEEMHGRFAKRLENLSEAQENFRPVASEGQEAWSIAEIVEHISRVEHQIVQLTGMMITKAEGAGMLRADPHAPLDAVAASVEPFIERSKAEKFVAPEKARPRGGVAVTESLARLASSHAALNDLRERAALVEGASLQYPHPVFGAFNLYQWLAMIGLHEERHLRQIEAVMQAPEYPKGDAATN